MTKKPHIKLIHIGEYMAEVEVELIETPEGWSPYLSLEDAQGWSPYLSLEDAQKLDDVREALRQGDLQKASNLAHLYKITPLTV